MSKKLQNALTQQKQQNEQVVPQITGILGLPLDGQRRVEVSNRNSYVYVRLRNNESEVIQAFNNQVAPAYNLPVLVEREGNRYIVIGVDTQRYENNWNSFAPFLPRHGNTHSFDLETGGGGDVVWVYPRQFTPLLTMPSGSSGGPNVIINPYMLHNSDGTWKYIGNTGTANITTYNPSSPTGAIIVLVYVDSVSGNPGLLVGSGTVFNSNITGVSQIAPYIPTITNPDWIPDSAIRLVTGTAIISWNNIYDVRQFLHPVPTGTGGGGGGGTTIGLGVMAQDEGVPLGTGTVFNFVGANVSASISGSVVRVFVTGSTGGSSTFSGNPSSVVLTDASGSLTTQPWLKWGTSSEEFIEFGADVVGKESNAGKIGYQTFDDNFDIVGAGTGSQNRTVQIYDDLIVADELSSNFMNLNQGSTYNILGVPHTHVSSVVVQDEGIPIGTGTVFNFVGVPVTATISGSIVRVFINTGTGVEEAPIDSVSYVRSNAAWTPVFTSQTIQDEGTQIGFAGTFNFVGANVSASISGSTVRVAVAGGWELIQDIQLTAGSAFTFDFQNIPSTYKHLKIEFVGRSNKPAVGSDGAKISFNNNTGSNYIGLIQWGAGQVEQATAGTPLVFVYTPAVTSPANYFTNSEVTIFNYADVNAYRTFQGRGMQIITNSAGNLFMYDSMGMFLSTGTAISRVTLYPEAGTQFTQWSRATLYGIL